MCWQAWQADTQAMWNWNSLYREGVAGNHQGAIPDGTTVFDDALPGVAKLDADLLGAVRRAATDATGDGIRFTGSAALK